MNSTLQAMVLRFLARDLIYILVCIIALELDETSSLLLAATFDRRSFLGTVALAPFSDAGILIPGGTAPYRPEVDGDWNDMPQLRTKIGLSRIGGTELSPLQQPPFDFNDELYYAPFLFGAWNVTATLKRIIYPYGTLYVPFKSLVEVSPRNREERVGNQCSYEVHYFSTLANTLANQLTVNLGTGVPESKIIQDRAFNAISISAAYRQLTPVQQVEWDYRQNPTKLTLDFGAGPVADDMRPLGQRRAELFLNARISEALESNVYACSERSRSVLLTQGAVVVSDSETISEFTKQSDDHVTAVSRIAVYLKPNPNSREGVLWQQVGCKAVGLYDYDLDMIRYKEEVGDANLRRACVRTPNDVIQCD